MKKILLAAAMCCFMFSACNKHEEPQPEPEVEAPELTLTSASEVSVGFEGDEVTITYTLENPAENGEITASASEGADWCSDFNCDTEGKVTFTVAANDGEERSCDVTVTYTYGESETKSITVSVLQVAAGDPNLKITSESEVKVGNDGGSVTVTYAIEDPASDGELTAASDAEWCAFSAQEDGQVTFDVAMNDGAARTSQITLTYTYRGGKTKTASVTVSQDEFKTPVLNITSASEVSMVTAGGQFTVTYTVENPVENGKTTASSEAEWCTVYNEEDGEIVFSVAANEGEARTCNVTLTYTYRETLTVTASVKVSQAEKVNYDYETVAVSITGSYYGDDYSNNAGEMMYQLFIVDNEELWQAGSSYYNIALFGGEPADMNSIAPPAGTYSMSAAAGPDVTSKETISKNTSYTNAYIYNEYGTGSRKLFSYGTCVIAEDGGNYTVDIVLTDTYNKTHHVTYSGPIALVDERQPEEPDEPDGLSNLTGDVDLNAVMTNISVSGYYWGSSRFTGLSEYVVSLSGDSNNKYVEFSVLLPSSNTFADGLQTGVYEISDSNTENTITAGYLEESTSWGVTSMQPRGGYYYDTSTGYYYPDKTVGLFAGGEIAITNNGDGTYTFGIDVYDDNGYAMTGNFTVAYNPRDYSW